MAKQVIKHEQGQEKVIQIEEKRIAEIASKYLSIVGQKVKQEDAVKFLHICKAFNLNPFKREIYLIPYGDEDEVHIVVGYETYLKRAERSGKLNGWRVWIETEEGEMKACVEIHRKDWQYPFRHEVYLREYRRNTQIWKEKPITMLKKVAISQAFRLCFPEELAGMPYTAAELPAEEEQQEEKQKLQEELVI